MDGGGGGRSALMLTKRTCLDLGQNGKRYLLTAAQYAKPRKAPAKRTHKFVPDSLQVVIYVLVVSCSTWTKLRQGQTGASEDGRSGRVESKPSEPGQRDPQAEETLHEGF